MCAMKLLLRFYFNNDITSLKDNSFLLPQLVLKLNSKNIDIFKEKTKQNFSKKDLKSRVVLRHIFSVDRYKRKH